MARFGLGAAAAALCLARTTLTANANFVVSASYYPCYNMDGCQGDPWFYSIEVNPVDVCAPTPEGSTKSMCTKIDGGLAPSYHTWTNSSNCSNQQDDPYVPDDSCTYWSWENQCGWMACNTLPPGVADSKGYTVLLRQFYENENTQCKGRVVGALVSQPGPCMGWPLARPGAEAAQVSCNSTGLMITTYVNGTCDVADGHLHDVAIYPSGRACLAIQSGDLQYSVYAQCLPPGTNAGAAVAQALNPPGTNTSTAHHNGARLGRVGTIVAVVAACTVCAYAGTAAVVW
eukprot:CAMPEP_0206311814 /NCGR_PEP_ID=MMETSP0106_2-20121207/13661_1 /ASSEMBLY_ACC=CAM_ASM_000206 /TAXON_ID=81532 /ORGANISM="Acanthoeca-like sp., Strain 10tr" /LENGTH=286 /DNA_ID=CAMNT_0053743081 /DNA_START=51 /DNA_END=908 /DNA_ORIENTATION=-